MITEKDVIEKLGEVHLFEGLGKRDLKKIVRIGFVRQYSQGEIVFEEDTPAGGVYILLKGSVEVKDTVKGTGKIKTYEVPAVSVIGETALIREELRGYSATALTDCTFLVVFRNDFLKLVDRKPRFGLKVMKNFSVYLAEELAKCRENLL